LQETLQFVHVDEIAVVGHQHPWLAIEKRLGIAEYTLAEGRIAHVSDARLAGQQFKIISLKTLANQPQAMNVLKSAIING
jgi:hypothetical protein